MKTSDVCTGIGERKGCAAGDYKAQAGAEDDAAGAAGFHAPRPFLAFLVKLKSCRRHQPDSMRPLVQVECIECIGWTDSPGT